MDKLIDYFKNIRYLIYLKYLRRRIGNIRKIKDIIDIMNNICFFNGKINTDLLTEILNDCLYNYPLNQNELQIISLLQQKYYNNLGIENYVSMMLWCSIIFSINEKENIKKNINLLEYSEKKTVEK
tara:strand:+ start:4593 stop:4970 length:378 start_codon:yes stop_codon:yes gene_type:complete